MRFWKGWCGSKGIEIDRSANIKASEALTIPIVTARNSFRIVKVGLSEYCTASQKIISAVPPPLFRGEARVIVLGKSTAKPTERSFKGKCGGAERGIVRFWKGWFGMKNGGTIPPVVARIFSGDSTSPLTREARMWCRARDSAVLEGLVWVEGN